MRADQEKHTGADLYAHAADWHTRMDDPKAGPVDRAELDAWLYQEPGHAAAYKAIERMWDNTRKLAANPLILKFRYEALAAVSSPAPRTTRRTLVSALGGIAVGAILFTLPLFRDYSSAEKPTLAGQKLDAGIFTTAVGERSTLTLSDGTSVVLDTQSRIDVAYSPEQRRVRLVSGQAWFQVAHNPARPFVVDAGDRRITALGTAFDVRLGKPDKSVQVTLVEGRVTVEAIQSPLIRLVRSAPPPSLLIPGDSLVVSDATPVLSHRADVVKISGWREGKLIFEGDTLDTAIAEMNRYSRTQIVLADLSLAKLLVSGVFQAGHSQSFIETVTGHYPIAAAEQADGRILLTARQPAASP